MFTCKIDDEVSLELIDLKFAEDIYKLTDESRLYLREWLPWIDMTRSVEDTQNFIKMSMLNFSAQKSITTVILFKGKVAGVAGYNEIDWINKKAYIGYWLGEEYQGQGIMTKVCSVLTDYALVDLKLNKVIIQAAENNTKSRSIPKRLEFTLEGNLRQNEWIYDHYVDHAVYGMLASEWNKKVKVTAYITRIVNEELQLLVFEEANQEHLGLQVPGGTVERGETLEDALIREITEESGIIDIKNVRYLGELEYVRDSEQFLVLRHYYQVEAGECLDKFTHVVKSKDEDNGWIYNYTWHTIKDRKFPKLFNRLGQYLNKI